mmetsp:Transcript_18686/g.42772  ORF Transcript_18686/g.42772 Transcript_18686/m.42772 type:complete len:299 (-) Transcript_18686:985-1881(-)
MDGSPNDVRQLFTQVGHESDFLLLFPHDLIALHNDGDEHVEEEKEADELEEQEEQGAEKHVHLPDLVKVQPLHQRFAHIDVCQIHRLELIHLRPERHVQRKREGPQGDSQEDREDSNVLSRSCQGQDQPRDSRVQVLQVPQELQPGDQGVETGPVCDLVRVPSQSIEVHVPLQKPRLPPPRPEHWRFLRRAACDGGIGVPSYEVFHHVVVLDLVPERDHEDDDVDQVDAEPDVSQHPPPLLRHPQDEQPEPDKDGDVDKDVEDQEGQIGQPHVAEAHHADAVAAANETVGEELEQEPR